jgi:hypothetical protein
MRIYFIHVYRRHWEFYPNDPPYEESDPMETEETKSGIVHWLQGRATRVWKSIDGAESGMRGWLRSRIESLNRRVDPTEPMLRRMRTAEKIEILYPSNVSPRFVQRRLRLLLIRKTVRHRRLAVINALLIPLTLAAGIIPGPNVFFFWNAYRLLSHIFADRGGRRVLAAEVRMTFTPSAELNELTSPEHKVSAPLDLAGASHIAERLGLPGLVEYLRRTGGLAGDSTGGLIENTKGFS